MATYNELVNMVRDWANRDISVLPDSIIQSCLRYSADEAYRNLEIPPLEHTRYYVTKNEESLIIFCTKVSEGVYSTVSVPNMSTADFDENGVNPTVSNTSFLVPPDAVSFIYLRTPGVIDRPPVGSTVAATVVTEDNQADFAIVSSNNTPSVTSHAVYKDTMYDERTDVKTFYDFNDNIGYTNYFTRKGGKILAAGLATEGHVLELFYYRRLPALDARSILPVSLTLAAAQASPDIYEVVSTAQYDALPYLEQRTYELVETSYVRYINEVFNWLKDHNERVLLFGALHRVFDFLQEEDQSQKYKARFMESVQELNEEERNRNMSAGQTVVRFGNTNLI